MRRGSAAGAERDVMSWEPGEGRRDIGCQMLLAVQGGQGLRFDLWTEKFRDHWCAW